jgi:hypothetical protein
MSRNVRRSLTLVVLLVVMTMVLAPTMVSAQTDDDEGVLIRVNGDALLAADQDAGLALTVRGRLIVEGTAKTVVVVNGTAVLRGATVDTLVVIRGRAILEEGTVVTGDVWLTNARFDRADGVQIDGTVRRNAGGGILVGLWILGIIIAIGLGVLAILGGLTFAAVAPGTARRAGNAIRREFGQVVLAGLVLWLAIPIAGLFLFITIVGVPTAIAIWLGVLPVMAFLGYIVTGIWLGELLVARQGGTGHPYLASFLGILLLVIAGVIPGLGGLIGTLASLLGGSALALLAWRGLRGEPSAPEGTVADPDAAPAA